MRDGKPFPPDEYKAIYSRVPRVTAEAVIRTSSGVVLVKRSLPDWHGMWHIPGVTVLMGETLEEAVKRAARQEVGITVTVQSCLGPYEFSDESKVRGWGQTIGIAYLCTTTDPIPSRNADGEDVGVFPVVPQDSIQEQKRVLERVLRQ